MVTEKITLKKQLEYQKSLNEITNKIHSARDTNEILLKLHGDLLDFFDADRLTIYVVDTAKKEIYSKIKTGNEPMEIRVLINKKSLAGYCAATGKLLNIKDVRDNDALRCIDPGLIFDVTWDEKTGYCTKQTLVVPVVYDRYLLGIIQLINKKTGDCFNQVDQAAVLDIAKVLGIAIFKNQKVAQNTRSSKFHLIISEAILNQEDINEAFARARKTGKSPEAILMSDFGISKDLIADSLSQHYNTRFIPYDDNMTIPGELLGDLKPGFFKTHVFIPVSDEGENIAVAMENPDYLPARDVIKRVIKKRNLEYCVSTREDIFRMIDHFFVGSSKDAIPDAGSIEEILGQLKTDDEDEPEESDSVAQDDRAIVQLINKTIIDAYARKASDIHVEPRPGKNNTVIRFRIDGACQVYQTIPYTFKRAIVSRLKIMSDLDISERRKPQDGKIKFKKFAPLDIELRVATIPTAGNNEDVVLRLLPAGKPMALDQMGMSDWALKAFTEMISQPYGIVLVVGPTGSGKTTTLHAVMAHINKPETKIWTAEDPVEITQEGLRQVQVIPKIGFNFASAMRAFLRADPDVIMVGEMRDEETVSMGIEASLTGHLVLSTLHTNSAPETITRLLDMGMDPFNFADALLGVLAQRLVRTLCKACKEPYHPAKKEFDGLVRAYDGDFDRLGFSHNNDFVLYRARGCPRCGHTGYSGRTAIHELLVGTEDIKHMIQNRSKVKELKQQAVKDGMATLMQEGIRKVCLGLTDFSQVRRVCM
ncbi:MAG: GspE/PulE family protein [Deltaproteobacteria bacterium]|jgi:type II secretory ATPase GspE/PulE/Tfp pilus assembly ATPase PilB-like protein|nr:GspE/PulE family protein [Deltaproteobacteria bacterium]